MNKKYLLPILAAAVAAAALVALSISQQRSQPETEKMAEETAPQTGKETAGNAAEDNSSGEEYNPQRDPELIKLQAFLDDDTGGEEAAIELAVKLMASKRQEQRLEAVKVFQWYGGKENLARLAKLCRDADVEVADTALDGYLHAFNSLQEAPDSAAVNDLRDLILYVPDSARRESLFMLTTNLDEATVLPGLIEILTRAREEDNEELAGMAEEYIDFATETGSGIDTLEKAQQWLDAHAEEL